MPLPLILGVGAVIAGVAGIGGGIYGAAKLKEAKDTMKLAGSCHENNKARFEAQTKLTTHDMDDLGKKELDILASFERFSEVFEKIQSKPQFATYTKDGVSIPKYTPDELKQVSIGAGLLLGGLGGAAVGTAGGFAAAGATTAAVMALGTASTGTAIATLSGVALTNATLAAIGGGAIAVGGGGMALGTTILGATTFGVGLLVGGVIFSIVGSSFSAKADEAWAEMSKAEKNINNICEFLTELSAIARKFNTVLSTVNKVYASHMDKLATIVEVQQKTEWSIFSEEEQRVTENTALLVNVLFNMCKVQLVLASGNENDVNTVNATVVDKSMSDAEAVLSGIGVEIAA